MDRIDHAGRAFGAVFLLSHRWRVLGDRLDDPVTTKQWFVLAALVHADRPDPSLTELAEFLGTSRQNVRKHADLLAKARLVTLTGDPADARVVRVRLTPHGEAQLALRDPLERALLDELFRGLRDDELAVLSGLLSRLTDHANSLVHQTGEPQ